MRIRCFNTYEPVTTLYRDLLPCLGEAGFSVEVLISAAEYRSSRPPLSEVINYPNVRITYLPAGGVLPTGRLQKVWLMFAYMVSAGFTSLFSPSVDMNFFLTQPPLFGLWGWMLKIFRGQPYICLLMDIYPDVAVQDGVLKKDSFWVRAFTFLTRITWQHAHKVIVIGRCMQERVISAGISPQKVHFIPNWINEQIVFPVEPNQNRLRHELGLDDAFVIVYSGNMGTAHEFQALLTAAELLLSEKHIHFVLIGDGCRRASLELYKQHKRLDNLTFLPYQPLEKLAESFSLGDLILVTLRDGFEGLVVPSKAYGAQGAGRPLLYVGHHKGEIARMITEEKIGAVISPQDGSKLAQTILCYFRQPELCKAEGQRAFDLCRGPYSRQRAMDSYIVLLRGN
jgi:glycosyltransferase involved in cell wall biosynthesis